MEVNEWPLLTAAALSAAALAPVQIVVAAEFLSIDDAQHSLFVQADRFEEIIPVLTSAQQRAVMDLAGPQPPHRSLRVWRAMQGTSLLGHVFLDEVIGRQDFITYAVGIDVAGRSTNLEVLAYRESHGAEIRNAAWREQFKGREGLRQLRFRADIKNIAGATLSSEHVTQGVRWLTALWQVILRPDENPATRGPP